MLNDLIRRRIEAQAGVVRRDQLAAAAVTEASVRAHLDGGRWQRITETVVATINGDLTAEQQLWAAVLNGGSAALLAGLQAAELARLRHWHRDEIQVLVPIGSSPPRLLGTRYVRTRRPIPPLRARGAGVPRVRLEPAVLLWAAQQDRVDTARGVVAATLQQQLSHPSTMCEWIDRLAPLRHSKSLTDTIEAAAGGSHSNAERHVLALCRRFGLAPPRRQVKRTDASGRVRFTDAEWWLPDGRIVHLEVDGAFHMSVEHWEDHIARQRALSAPHITSIRCTAVEACEGSSVARDLLRLGVPRVA